MYYPERRKYKRSGAVIRVLIKTDADKPFKYFCDSKDLSEGGILFLVKEKVVPGTDISISFSLPRCDRAITVPGEVIWALSSPESEDLFGIGVKFGSLVPGQREMLKEYIAGRENQAE